MKTKIYPCFLIAFISFWVHDLQAQDPNWYVNASDYQYSMTFTTFLNVNGATLTSENDRVAAFVNGEVRGVSNVVYVASANKYVSYLSVYANTDNEIINFKIYSSSSDTIVDIGKTTNFIIDGSIGGIFQSFSIANPQLSENAVFNSFSFSGITSVVEEITSDKINIVLPENTPITSLNAVFNASDNSKVFVSGVLQVSGSSMHDFSNPIIYKVLSENEAVLTVYEVVVSSALNNDPLTVSISTSENLNTNSIPVSLDINFSQEVSGFDISDFTLENAVLSSFSNTDLQNYSVEVIPLSQGAFSVQIPANISLDENNNQNIISNKLELIYDISKPLISAVSVDSDASSWWFLVSFNETVLNVDISDFELKGAASSGLVISDISSVSDNQYRVNISNSNSDIGTVSVQLKNNNDIKDIAGNSVVFSEFEAYYLSKTAITITADAKTKIYGELDPELTYKITSGSLETGDVFSGLLARVVGEDVGEYEISSTLANEKYEITFVSDNLSITEKEITITADTKSKIYGELDPELTYQITSGNLIDRDVLIGNLIRNVGENVGEYPISSTLSNSNYNITYVAANFNIFKKPITILADAKTKLFGASDPVLTYSIIIGGLEIGDVLSGSLSREVGESVGDYTISSTLSSLNYSITYIPSFLRITIKQGIVITADSKTKIYGEIDIELTYQITSGVLQSGDVLTGVLIREVGENAGNYLISSTLTNNEYDIIYVPANFSISKREITITTDSITKIYGELDPELTYRITSGNLLNGDVLSGDLTRVVGENVGEYAIYSTVSNDNYDITFTEANLQITKREITITADIKTKAVGDIDPLLTYQITQGNIIAGDAFSGDLNREVGEMIGIYLISLGTLTLGENYEMTFVEANFEISATASIEDTFLSNHIKLYPNPVKNFLTIEIENQIDIKEVVVYNLLGKLIQREKKIYEGIQLQNLTAGTYLIKIITNQGIAVKRIVKN
jgi:hypothetical protein